MTQYYCYTRSEYRLQLRTPAIRPVLSGGVNFQLDFSSLFTVAVLPACFFYSAVPLQSIDCFCSSLRLIASLLARFALVRRRNCSCSYSHQFRFSPSIVYALLLARSASVRRLFLLFSSINSFSSRQFRSSPSIVSAVLVARSASVRRLFLLF